MLPNPLRTQLVSALLAIPRINNQNRRDELLSNLPPNIVDGLNRDSAPSTDLNGVVSQLDRLGRLTATGERPVAMVAEAALPFVEGTEAGRRLTDVMRAIEEHYGLAEPPAPPVTTPAAPPATVETRIPEAIIFGDERVSYGFVDRALASAASIARLMVPRLVGGKWGSPMLGTGWLIAPGLVVTNHHVAAARGPREAPATDDECRGQVAEARAWFDYRIEGGPRDERAVAELVCANRALDYAILRLRDAPARSPLPIHQDPPTLMKGDRLNIVQHPRGGPVKYAIRSNHYVGTDPGQPHLLRYLTDTEGGASGSPVLDDTWRVVALHHAAMQVPPQEHHGQVTYVNNEGIAIHAVLNDLPAKVRQAIALAQGWGRDAADA